MLDRVIAEEDETSCHPEGELREREGSGRADLSVPQILWVAAAPRRMTSGSRGPEIRTCRFEAEGFPGLGEIADLAASP